MSDLNIRFSNCFDFINETKRYLEANPTDWRNVYTEEALAHAECDLMEMELEALYDTEEYDSVLNGNASRSSKRANRRKANIRYHKADRKHGKPIPQSDKKYWDEQSGTFYRWDEKRKTFSSPKKPIVHRNRKTFRDHLNSAMTEREKDLLAFDDLFDKSQLVVKKAKKETDPIRKTQLWDLDRNLTDAMCVDFYDGWYPDLSVTPERF